MSEAGPAPIFIVGCPRSGTTLLRNLLRSHPHLSFWDESHFIPQLYAAYGDPRSEREARRLTNAILKQPRMRSWNCDFDQAALVACRSYASLVDEIFGTRARREGKQRWGDKTPHYVLHMHSLAAIFPAAQFIHIYRDGRDVALSWIAAAHGPENWFTAAKRWRTMVQAGRRAGAKLGSARYIEVRYETLLSDLEGTLRRVCDFLGEPFDGSILTQSVMKSPPRLHRVRSFRPFSGGYNNQPEVVTGNVNKWKSAASLEQRKVFESVAGDWLKELGYETEGFSQPIPLHARWRWKAQSWVLETLVRLNTRDWTDLSLFALRKWESAIRSRLRRPGVHS